MKYTRSLLSLTALLLGAVLLLGSCEGKPTPPATDTTATVTDSGESTPETTDGAVTEAPTEEITTDGTDTEPALLEIIKEGQKRATYRILHDKGADTETVQAANMLSVMIKSYTGCEVNIQDTSKNPTKKILFNCDERAETAALKAGLAEGV